MNSGGGGRNIPSTADYVLTGVCSEWEVCGGPALHGRKGVLLDQHVLNSRQV